MLGATENSGAEHGYSFLKENNFQPRILCLAESAIKCKDRIQIKSIYENFPPLPNFLGSNWSFQKKGVNQYRQRTKKRRRGEKTPADSWAAQSGRKHPWEREPKTEYGT